MNGSNYSSIHERWANFRFSVVGHLLASPPPKGELRAQLKELAAREWRHPITGEPVHFGVSTIEAWYYQALREPRDPVRVLRRKVRKDSGLQDSLNLTTRQAILAQYANHKSWSIQLHWENLRALAEERTELRPLPCYSTVRRFFKAQGLYKRRRVTSRRTEGAERAEARLSEREVRSYETEYVNGLVHWDAHCGSRKILTSRGEWATPLLFGVIDDRSRLVSHLQWYWGAECAQNLVHTVSQAFMRRGIPRTSEDSHVRGNQKRLVMGRRRPTSLIPLLAWTVGASH